jgi:hypothetical protein
MASGTPAGGIVRRIFILSASVGLLGVMLVSSTSIVEQVEADELVIMQDPLDGELHFWTQPGLYLQAFGRVTTYRKSSQFWFSSDAREGETRDESIFVRFNDGGEARISGSVRFDLPLAEEFLTKLHTRFGSMAAVEHDLIRQVINKSVFMTGPLMSSKESYAERKTDLIHYIGDQVAFGVYRTRTLTEREKDPLSGEERTVSRVELVEDSKGGFQRQEESPLQEYGVRAYNFTINAVHYDERIVKQIEQQQAAVMQVQTAIAKAREAEQNAITAAKEGEAAAAQAKWQQEVFKAKAVTEAEQKREVAKLEMEAAEFYKKEQILRGEGDAERKRLVMQADGALEQKLAAYVDVMKAFAPEIGKQRWVPEVVYGTGAAGAGSGSSATQLIDMLSVKTARDLALDLEPSVKR